MLQPLIGAVDEELLSAHVTALLDKGLPSLLEAPPRMRELRLLYGLVGRVGGLAQLKMGLGAFVRRAGTALMVNQDKDKDMVQVCPPPVMSRGGVAGAYPAMLRMLLLSRRHGRLIRPTWVAAGVSARPAPTRAGVSVGAWEHVARGGHAQLPRPGGCPEACATKHMSDLVATPPVS